MKKYKVVGRFCEDMPLCIYIKNVSYQEACYNMNIAKSEGWYNLEVKEV